MSDIIFSRLRPAQSVAPGWPFLLRGALAVAALGAAGWFFTAVDRVPLVVIGLTLGVALFHASFGFAHGFRVLITEGRSAHVRAQLLMLGVAVLLFFPALAAGEVAGQTVRGFVFPLGVGVIVGAFLFGIGMQIAGGCISGTLYTAGGGSLKMAVTLVSAIGGATLAAYTFPVWGDWPALPGVSLIETLGAAPALALNLAVFAALFAVLTLRERRRHGSAAPIFGKGRLLTGPWPYAWAALALAVLNFATLLAAGRPWGVTQAFATWGSLALQSAGQADPVFWPYWEEPVRVDFLLRPLTGDATTIMNVAVLTGALVAALAAGRFATRVPLRIGAFVGAVIGGGLLGFGAIMATGCNISAFFSGIASGSLHGWLWIAAALPGVLVGLRLRPLFGLDR